MQSSSEPSTAVTSTVTNSRHEIEQISSSFSLGSPKSILDFMNSEKFQADRSHISRPNTQWSSEGAEEVTMANSPPRIRLKQRCNHTNPLWNTDNSHSQGNQGPEDEAQTLLIRTTDYVKSSHILEIRVEDIPSSLMMPIDF